MCLKVKKEDIADSGFVNTVKLRETDNDIVCYKIYKKEKDMYHKNVVSSLFMRKFLSNSEALGKKELEDDKISAFIWNDNEVGPGVFHSFANLEDAIDFCENKYMDYDFTNDTRLFIAKCVIKKGVPYVNGTWVCYRPKAYYKEYPCYGSKRLKITELYHYVPKRFNKRFFHDTKTCTKS